MTAEAEAEAAAAAAAARRRGIVIGAVGAAVVVVLAVTLLVGERRADQAVARVRARAAEARLSGSDVVGDLYSADGVVARKLGVEPTEVAISSPTGDRWCVTVTVHRMAAARSVSYTFVPNEPLVPVERC